MSTGRPKNEPRRGDLLTGRKFRDLIRELALVIEGGPGIKITRIGNRLTVSAVDYRRNRPVTFWARITGSTNVSENIWQYDWTEVVADGAATMETKTNPRSEADYGVAHNMSEEMNSATGLQGNGVVIEHLPAGFAIQPVATGRVVLMHIVTDIDGETKYAWFDHDNGVDGECEEP